MWVKPFRDLTGMQFGRLTAIASVKLEKPHKRFWQCICSCGNTANVKSGYLLRGNTRSCGCLKREDLSNRRRKADGEEGFNQLILKYKYGARKRNLEYSLSNADAVRLFKSNCTYCGVTPQHGIGRTTRFIYNGIDRRDNAVGYTVGNTVACCTACNFLKGSLSYSAFVERVSAVYINLFGGKYE